MKPRQQKFMKSVLNRDQTTWSGVEISGMLIVVVVAEVEMWGPPSTTTSCCSLGISWLLRHWGVCSESHSYSFSSSPNPQKPEFEELCSSSPPPLGIRNDSTKPKCIGYGK